MPTAARLQHLNGLVQGLVDALSNLPDPDPDHASDADSDAGGVSLEPSLPEPPIANCSPKEVALEHNDNPERRFVWIQDANSSYNPDPHSLQMPSGPPKAPSKLPATDLQRGDLVSARHHFVPIQALARYPYKFCDKSRMQPIATAFFDQGKFWEREWDLYYVWDIEPTKPLVLVQESQFQALLDDINEYLKLGLKITDQQRQDSLVVCFPEHPRCRPRYLGRSHSRREFDSMVGKAPSAAFRAARESPHPTPDGGTLEDFKQMMEELWDVQKAKSKAIKAKKQQEQTAKRISTLDQLKRAQRYLGLLDSSLKPAAIDTSLPAPFAFEYSAVFVCIDVESYERDHTVITEVGVATLDTRDLIGIPPGIDGTDWRSKIRARHFRIREYKHLVNKDFVNGCPDRFDFGQSTIVSTKDAATMVSSCFEAPFGAHESNGAEKIAELMRDVDPREQRNVILLGHDTLGDIRYLQQLGYDPMHANNILEALDTSILYRALRRENQATNLGKILWSFDIAGWNLHNAGNDAVFTVQAMLAICVRHASIRGTPEHENMQRELRDTRVASMKEELEQKVKDDTEGWDETDGDGGAPVPLANPPPKAKVEPKTSATPKTRSNALPQSDGASDRLGRGGNVRGRGRGSQLYSGNFSQSDRGRGRRRGNLPYNGPFNGNSNQSDRGRGRGRGNNNGRGSAGPTQADLLWNSEATW